LVWANQEAVGTAKSPAAGAVEKSNTDVLTAPRPVPATVPTKRSPYVGVFAAGPGGPGGPAAPVPDSTDACETGQLKPMHADPRMTLTPMGKPYQRPERW